MRHQAALLLALALFCSLSFATVKWSVATADAISGKGVVAGGIAVFSSYNGKVYGINATSGAIVWTYDSGSKIILEPVLADAGTAAVIDSDGKLALLSASDGSAVAEVPLNSSPVSIAAGGGRVFVASEGNVTAFDTAGSRLWNSAFKSPIGQLGFGDGALYFTSDGEFDSVAAETGALNWAVDAEDSFLSRPVQYLWGVYFGATDGKLYSFEASNGRLRWSYETGGWIMSTPLVMDSGAYFGSNDGYFYSVSPAGLLRFRFQTSDAVWAEPEAYENKGRQLVVFGANDGKLYALDATTGEQQWAFSSYGTPGSTTRNGDGFLFGTSNGRIYYLVPTPICSFTHPDSLDTVGNFVSEVEGRASADSGVSKVEVRANNGAWVEATGKESWYADLDFTPVAPGAVTVECRTHDNEGNVESGDYSFLMLIKSDTAQQETMYVSAPSEVGPKDSFNVSAKDDRGIDLRGATISVGGVNQTGDSPFAVTLGRSGLVPISISKPGFEAVSFTVSGRSGPEFLIGALAALLVILALLYFFVIRKMLRKR